MGTQLLKRMDGKESEFAPIHILEIGCGTGYLTKKLSQQFPEATITAIDFAPGMIEIAKQRINDERVHFLCGDIEEMGLKERYDLIISNATFQWLNDMENTLIRLSHSLKNNGRILFQHLEPKHSMNFTLLFLERCKNGKSIRMPDSGSRFTH